MKTRKVVLSAIASFAGFSFFGMRSKSRENVLSTNTAAVTSGENNPQKLMTVDKAIDKSRKYKVIFVTNPFPHHAHPPIPNHTHTNTVYRQTSRKHD